MQLPKLAVLALFATTLFAASKIFPYPYVQEDLPNGLRLITIPTDYPNIVSLYIVVHTGSRNEVEPGKSGFAHLFEHLMFRGTPRYPAEKYTVMVKADRFQNLKYSPEGFKTETLAVLGEYNKNSANPAQKLDETVRDTAFLRHT